MVVRNASLRLPYLFEHYRSCGVDRFFVVDNDSNDGTIEFLKDQPDTHSFHTSDNYSESMCGIVWVEHIANQYGIDHWCLFVDEDEILTYPHWEDIGLKEFCQYLDIENATALHSFLLDMYSDKTIRDTAYQMGESFLDTCPFFETGNLERNDDGSIVGGVRKRVFGAQNILSKYSLVKYTKQVTLQGGFHRISGAQVSKVVGATLHFKYFFDFAANVQEEIVREQHWNNADQYKRYARGVSAQQDLSLHCPESIRLRSSQQLLDLKIMETTPTYEAFVRGN